MQLYDLPFDMLEMIGKSYDELAQRDSTATLQATLKRHVVTRCEDPRPHRPHQHARRGPCAVLPVLPQSPEECQMLGDADRVLQPHHGTARAEEEGSCVGVAVKVEEPNHL